MPKFSLAQQELELPASIHKEISNAETLSQNGVPESSLHRMRKQLADLHAAEFDYPWNGLEISARQMPSGKLLLIGYGSLLNRDSAARTIKDTPPKGHTPVVALGAIRIFNYLMPDEAILKYGTPPGPKQKAALNMIYTKSPFHGFNGRLLQVDPADIPKLREREFGYDLRPVVCQRWGDWDSASFVAYILVAQKPELGGRKVIDNNALPYPPYARVCRKGAADVSDNFLQIYLNTTYLADLKTQLKAWESTHPDAHDEPEILKKK
jgi:hypothetical protein